MPTLLLKFYVYLTRTNQVMRNFEGPLFHRWLPDGENDAIVLATGTADATLKVWFERRGYTDDRFITYDITRKEVDSAIIPMQAALVAGSLFGSLEIRGLAAEEVASLRDNNIGEQNYIRLGIRVVNTLIYPPVARFINTLRTKYGQYWIREYDKWDSSRSLGRYCKLLRLQWSLDQGDTWFDFIPDQPIAKASIFFGHDDDFRQYLTKDDWKDLAQLSQEKYEPSLAASILTRALQFFDEDDYKYALIEGVTALELSLTYYIRSHLKISPSLANLKI